MEKFRKKMTKNIGSGGWIEGTETYYVDAYKLTSKSNGMKITVFKPDYNGNDLRAIIRRLSKEYRVAFGSMSNEKLMQEFE